MTERERQRDDSPRAGGAGDAGGGPELSRARQAGDDLLAAGDDAIRRALSGDSQGFLRANRQEGGE